MQNKLVTSRMVVYGEGCIAPVFVGSIWTKDETESEEQAQARYGKMVTDLGMTFLPEMPH